LGDGSLITQYQPFGELNECDGIIFEPSILLKVPEQWFAAGRAHSGSIRWQ
jgi:hypothetical protein